MRKIFLPYLTVILLLFGGVTSTSGAEASPWNSWRKGYECYDRAGAFRNDNQLEQALERDSRKKREYGCTEVTIGFRHNGHGDEIVDYMSMDAREIFRCYELKVSFSDLKSNNHLSWYGDYNYLVISERMLLRPIPYDNYVPPYVGILAGESGGGEP